MVDVAFPPQASAQLGFWLGVKMCQARKGKKRNGKETGKERVLSFPVPPFLGTRFFPVSGQNHEKRVKNEGERPKNGGKDVERRRTTVPRHSKL